MLDKPVSTHVSLTQGSVEFADRTKLSPLNDIYRRLAKLSHDQGTAVQALGFDKRCVYVFLIFGNKLIEEKGKNYSNILEIGQFFWTKQIRFRVVFFTDPDKYEACHKAGNDLYKCVFTERQSKCQKSLQHPHILLFVSVKFITNQSHGAHALYKVALPGHRYHLEQEHLLVEASMHEDRQFEGDALRQTLPIYG